MARFGWAYISGSKAGGINDSVQVKKNQDITGSSNFTYDIDSSTIALTGTLNVSGTINANAFNLDVTSKNVTNLSVTGSSKFGDTSDDLHQFTGSVSVLGAITSSTQISASSFHGDGSSLTGIISDPLSVTILSGSTAVSGGVGRFGQITGSLDASNLVGTLNLGVVSGSTAVSGAIGQFGQITGSLNATNLVGNLSLGILSGTTAISGALGQFGLIQGPLSSNTQTAITSVGTLTGLTTSGAITGSSMNLTGLAPGVATTSNYLALDSNNNVVLTSSSGGGGAGTISVASGSTTVASVDTIDISKLGLLQNLGSGDIAVTGTIGLPEDGNYADGLYTDFTSNTTIGTAVDRFNEVFKILAPSPAPNLQSIYYDQALGVTANLSFDAANVIPNYTASATDAGFLAIAQNSAYSSSTSGANYRLGVYNSQEITGTINYNVAENVTNGNLTYASGAFGNGDVGTLKLELNGTVIHSVALSGFTGAGQPATGSATSLTNGSGFVNFSIASSSIDGNGSEWYIFKYRTAKYKIEANDQNKGWNYLRVIHSVSSTDYSSNYIEWVNDPDGASAALTVSNNRIDEISLVGSKYLSGVQYNTNATAKYKTDINNLYKNVFSPSGTPISFSVSNSSTPSAQSVEDIGGSEDHNKVLGVTASLSVNANVNNLLSGSITCNTTVTHPLKSTISNTGSATTNNGFLIDNRTLVSSKWEENFHDETYRKTSGSYDTQTLVTSSDSFWNSENHMTSSGAAGHDDGLLLYNQRLYSPVDADIPVGGNFSAVTHSSPNQPNYSGVVGTRTYYRVVSNSSGVSKRDMKIVSTKVGTSYTNNALDATNIHFFAKIPDSTGWMDISQNFVYGSTLDGHGAIISGAPNDVDNGNNTHYITFGTQSVANNHNIMIKILADESWGGYISALSFSVGATTNTATRSEALDNVDSDNTGVSARLSFGLSGSVSNYISATGSSISLVDYNINDSYTVSGNRRGVFSFKNKMSGTLNSDEPGDGLNHSIYAFRNAYTGSLVLEVNGTDVHTIDLISTLSSISSSNANSSGFVVSTASFSTTSDSIPDYTKPYRTGSYHVGPSEQSLGWNYARVKHVIGTDITSSNYIEWIVDSTSSVDDTVVSAPSCSHFGHTSVYYQSGIGYFASNPTASFSFTGSNFYTNIYSNDASAVLFPTTTNCGITSITLSGSGLTTKTVSSTSTAMALLNSSSNCQLTDIHVTGAVQFDGSTPSISGGLGIFTDRDISITGKIKHPYKSDKTTSAASKTSMMIYSGSIGSSTVTGSEYFNTETYRIVSGNYVNQSDTTSSANSWNSETAMNAANAHGDGLVTVNGFAISPFNIGNNGDTRSVIDGGSLQSPNGNPNYSSLTNATRSYYRYFQNNTGQAKPSFSISMFGDANLVSKSGASYTGILSNNKNIHVELKVPYDSNFSGADDTSTAWADCIRPYSLGVQPITDGVGVNNNGGSLDQTVDSSGTTIQLQLLEKQVRDNQIFVLKISTHKDWTGYLSGILINY